MKTLRYFLFPFSILYGIITWLRNKCYDFAVFKSFLFEIPIITVGNLSVGGTGKTPQIEYLIRLLKSHKRVAVLSRGYKRKTSGFLLAKKGHNASDLGDEPFQYFRKFPKIIVAVDENRVRGIQYLIKLINPPEVILLDDAFQHRSVKPGLSILLTAFNDLFVDDFMLPSGNLREYASGANRADIIVVTKSPAIISDENQLKIKNRLNISKNQQIYFSTVSYNEILSGGKEKLTISNLKDYEVILISGIANPNPLLSFLKSQEISFKHLEFSDHHHFTSQEIAQIKVEFNKINAEKKIILTTEKDYVRTFANLENCYFISITISILNNEANFSQKILNYVG